jgi:DNA primase
MSTLAIDFQQVKQAATPEHVMRYLGITLKKHGDVWRGSCHLCKNSDPRAFVITDSKRLFHCFKCKEGGDMLKLVSVSKGVPVRDAAIELSASKNSVGSRDRRFGRRAGPRARHFSPLASPI